MKTGVRQGYILSPAIFLIIVDWIMKETTKGNKTEIQWTFLNQFENLDLPDNIDLLSQQTTTHTELIKRCP
jgi:hypothetical protein